MLVEATTADASLAARVAGASLQGVPDVTLQAARRRARLRDGVLPLTFARAVLPSPARPFWRSASPSPWSRNLKERIKGVVLPAAGRGAQPANEPWCGSSPAPSASSRSRCSSGRWTPARGGDAGPGADNRVVVQGAPLIAQIR
jgi:cobalt-zinc-cadmium efflux system membrane fusion protein